MASLYTQQIIKLTGATEEEALIAEGYMRLEYPTLDGLSPQKFKREAVMCVQMARQFPEEGIENAKSYGLIR